MRLYLFPSSLVCTSVVFLRNQPEAPWLALLQGCPASKNSCPACHLHRKWCDRGHLHVLQYYCRLSEGGEVRGELVLLFFITADIPDHPSGTEALLEMPAREEILLQVGNSHCKGQLAYVDR